MPKITINEKEIEFDNGSKTYNVVEEIAYLCSHYERILGKENWQSKKTSL